MVMKKNLIAFTKEIYLDSENSKLRGIDHIIKKVTVYR